MDSSPLSSKDMETNLGKTLVKPHVLMAHGKFKGLVLIAGAFISVADAMLALLR